MVDWTITHSGGQGAVCARVSRAGWESTALGRLSQVGLSTRHDSEISRGGLFQDLVSLLHTAVELFGLEDVALDPFRHVIDLATFGTERTYLVQDRLEQLTGRRTMPNILIGCGRRAYQRVGPNERTVPTRQAASNAATGASLRTRWIRDTYPSRAYILLLGHSIHCQRLVHGGLIHSVRGGYLSIPVQTVPNARATTKDNRK
jgi:hypothetical protein